MDPMSYTDWFIRILLMKKTQANQLIWKFIPLVTRFFDIPGGAGFLPSRVCWILRGITIRIVFQILRFGLLGRFCGVQILPNPKCLDL